MPKHLPPATSSSHSPLHKMAQQPALQLQRKREALQTILNTGLAGLGLGATARGLMGLRSMLASKPSGVALTSSVPTTIPITVPQPAAEEEEQPTLPFRKAAADGWFDSIAKQFPDIHTSHPTATAWGIPATIGAGALSAGAGWGVIDWLLNKRRESEQQGKLDSAQNEYEQALTDQYQQALSQKHASGPYAALDRLFDRLCAMGLEKEGGWWDDTKQMATDAGHMAGGGYLTALLGLTGGAGYATYNWAKSRSKQRLLDKAMALRARQRQAPQPVYAVPTPMRDVNL